MSNWINGSSTDDLFVFYATWKPNTYTVSYNANGGSGSMSASTHTYDTTKALTANVFTRSGYTFLGWSTNSSATAATYTDNQSVKNLTATNGGTVTLYAVWQKNPATVFSISIQSKPTKTVYTVGETFNSSGLSVKVNMSDGTTKTLTSGFTVSSPNMATAGTKTVTVTYHGKTTTFTITVNNPPAKVKLGDVNGDGKIKIVDAKWILQSIANLRNLNATQKTAADVNKDGKITIVDAKWVLQIIAGLRDETTLNMK